MISMVLIGFDSFNEVLYDHKIGFIREILHYSEQLISYL